MIKEKPLDELVTELDELERKATPVRSVTLAGERLEYTHEINLASRVFADLIRKEWPRISAKLKDYEEWEERWAQRGDRYKREADLLRDAIEPPCLQICSGCYHTLSVALAEADKIRRGEA